MRLLRQVKSQAKRLQFMMLGDQAYLRAYAKNTDARVQRNYKDAVGGLWEQIGSLQFAFLVRQGLKPESTLLDIGCGTLRGGRRFIRYLNSGKYTGFDISSEAIAACRRLVEQEALFEKRPELFVRPSGSMDLSDLPTTYDFILAQSVFTHLRYSHIENCFASIGKIMHDRARFYFTFNPGKISQSSYKDFSYPPEVFTQLAKRYAFDFSLCEYDHPRGQKMGMVRKGGNR
jgi:cyclopropane fatty-acyl-phospholipid synthase-like methyltransferase